MVPLLGSSYGPVLRTESSKAVPRARGRGLHLGSFMFLSIPLDPSVPSGGTDLQTSDSFLSSTIVLCWVRALSRPHCAVVSLMLLFSPQADPLPPQTSFYTQELCSLLAETISFVF